MSRGAHNEQIYTLLNYLSLDLVKGNSRLCSLCWDVILMGLVITSGKYVARSSVFSIFYYPLFNSLSLSLSFSALLSSTLNVPILRKQLRKPLRISAYMHCGCCLLSVIFKKQSELFILLYLKI